MRLVRTFVAAVLAAFVIATPATAITGNFVEDNVHPYVGLLVLYDENGEFLGRCSGSLISPSLFLTAGHCVFDATSARVYFHQAAGANFDLTTEIDLTTGYPEYCIEGDPLCVTASTLLNLGYDPSNFYSPDVGLVILDQPVTFLGYASLAEAGALDVLATQRGLQDISFTVSGYGVSRINPVQYLSYRIRLMATERLINLRSAVNGGIYVQTTANPGGGRGGTCFGDSGGPVFYDATSTIVSVTSFGINPNCRGSDWSFRIDSADVLAWIQSVAAQYGESVTIVPI